MNAHDLRVAEAAAPYRVAPLLTHHLDTFASASEGFKRLRELVLNLAVRGRLVAQDAKDEPADKLLERIASDKARLIGRGEVRRGISPPAIAEGEEPYRLPTGWKWARLAELALSVKSGGTPSKNNPAYWDGPIPWASVKDLGFGEAITDTQDSITEDGLKNGSVLVQPGAIIICTRMGLGKIGEAALAIAINQDLKALQLGDGIHKAYFISFFKTLSLRGTGMTVSGIKQDELLATPVPVPPLAEQSRIVAKVEELMALIATLEAKVSAGETARGRLLEVLLAALADSPDAAATAEAWAQLAPHFDLLLQTPADVNRLQQILLQLAVKGRLVPQDPNDEPAAELLKRIRAEKERLVSDGKIKRDKPVSEIDAADALFFLPQGWAWARIATIAEIGSGTTPSRTEASFYAPPEIPWVTSGETSQSFIFDTREKVSQRALKETSLKLYPPHSLLVALYGQGKTRGQVSELMIAATTNQACAVIVLHGVAFECKSYIKLYFQRIYEELRELSAGGAQPNLNVGKVADTLIPIPPLPEQSRIVAAVASLTVLCDRLRERLAARRALSAKLAAALTESALA